MKRQMTLSTTAACFALFALSAHASDVVSPVQGQTHVPTTAHAVASADLIARAERAFTNFVSTCRSGIASPFASECTVFGPRSSVSNLWIFPTADGKSVFVRYDVRDRQDAKPETRLSLIDMSGERIERIMNL